MSVILFYTPFYRRSRDVESLMLAFKEKGHRVISLTQLEGRDINPFLQTRGIEAFSYYLPGNPNFFYFLRHLLYFIRFCWRNDVSIVFSHLDAANFVASIGQYFIRSKVYLCRHHIDEAALYNYNLSWSYRLTNLFSRKIIAVSKHSVEYMIKVEGISPRKLIHINLAYDFSLFPPPDKKIVETIRSKYGGAPLLITVCRLTNFKRPDLSIKLLEKLRKNNINAKLIILGSGDMQSSLEEYVNAHDLNDVVFFLGHIGNVLEYIAAGDFLIHPSVLESSCVVVKEAGLVERPVIVCRGIGDFDDYIHHGRNGFLVRKDHFVDDASEIIAGNLDSKVLNELGRHLRDDVLERFDIRNIISNYDFIFKR